MTNEIAVAKADEVNKLHEAIVSTAKITIELVIDLGEKLVGIKEELPHGLFQEWVRSNCKFSMRTAQNYMRVFLRKDEVEEVEDLSSAYALLENKTIKAPEEPSIEPSLEEPQFNEPENNLFYWPELLKCHDALLRAYDKLSDKRDHTTPESIAHFVGNLKDMALRISSWKPDNLTTCPVCKGSMVVDGNPCNICIDGKIGKWTKSTY